MQFERYEYKCECCGLPIMRVIYNEKGIPKHYHIFCDTPVVLVAGDDQNNPKHYHGQCFDPTQKGGDPS